MLLMVPCLNAQAADPALTADERAHVKLLEDSRATCGTTCRSRRSTATKQSDLDKTAWQSKENGRDM